MKFDITPHPPDIVSKLFGKAKPDQPSPATEPIPDPAAPQAAAPDAPPPTAPLADVDIAAVMDQLVSESGETLNWRTSIVLNADPSCRMALHARRPSEGSRKETVLPQRIQRN